MYDVITFTQEKFRDIAILELMMKDHVVSFSQAAKIGRNEA
jgi:hypothetical protein